MSLCARSRWTWRARVLAGDPLRFARRQRDLAVDRQRELERDPRPAELEPGEPAGQRALRRLAPDAERHLDPGRAQPPDALAGGARIGILERDHDPRGLRCEQQVGAGRAARAVVRAGLQRHIDGRAVAPACRPARARPPRRAAVRPARSRPCRRSVRRAETITQPTFGLGAVRPRASSPSRSASSMKRRSLPWRLHPELFLELLELPLLFFFGRLPSRPCPSSGRR